MYGQDLTGVGWVGALLKSLAHVKRKSVPSSSHTALAALDCPFHSGFMTFCIISVDYEHVQWSWRHFSAPDFPGFNIYYQGQQSTDPDSLEIHLEIHLEIQRNSHQHIGPPHHFSVLQTSSPLPSRGFHTGACRSHGDLFQNGSPAILTLAHITVTGKKTTATASPSLPKMDFIKTLLLAMGLVSPLELRKRDVSADSKWKWTRFGEENAFFERVIKHILTGDFIYKGSHCALGWKACEHSLGPAGHCWHVINLSSPQWTAHAHV